MSDEFQEYLRTQRQKVEDNLRSSLQLIADAPAPLRRAVEYSLLANGKRLRPILVILAAEACGGSEFQAIAAANAVEMIHAYSLVHDDLPAMDDDDWRRGQPTCHKQFGEALAILAGDALLTLAFQVLAEGYEGRTAATCCAELARAVGAVGMVGGQVADLTWDGRIETENRPQPVTADLEAVHERKTGALFRACLRLGVHSVHGTPEQMHALDSYGECLGQAFQITDDILDAEGDAEQTGKRVQKDAAKGKLTYTTLLGLEASRARAQTLCAQARSHVRPFGKAGERLGVLTDYVLERDR